GARNVIRGKLGIREPFVSTVFASCAARAWTSQTAFKRCSVEAHHRVGTAVFAGARGRSFLAPANLALWKVDKELDGVVQPPVVDFSRCDVGLLVFVQHLPASRLFLPLVPRPVGLAL